MEPQEQIFQITVQINPGMEPTTLTITKEKSRALSSDHDLVFKVTRDKDSEQLAVLHPDADHRWQILEGKMHQEEIALIGAAIDSHTPTAVVAQHLR